METRKKTVTSRSKRATPSAPVARGLYDFRSFEMLKTAIGHYSQVLSLGYSEKNWEQADSIRRSISSQVDLNTQRALGDMMTAAYADLSFEAISTSKNKILVYLNDQVERIVP